MDPDHAAARGKRSNAQNPDLAVGVLTASALSSDNIHNTAWFLWETDNTNANQNMNHFLDINVANQSRADNQNLGQQLSDTLVSDNRVPPTSANDDKNLLNNNVNSMNQNNSLLSKVSSSNENGSGNINDPKKAIAPKDDIKQVSGSPVKNLPLIAERQLSNHSISKNIDESKEINIPNSPTITSDKITIKKNDSNFVSPIKSNLDAAVSPAKSFTAVSKSDNIMSPSSKHNQKNSPPSNNNSSPNVLRDTEVNAFSSSNLKRRTLTAKELIYKERRAKAMKVKAPRVAPVPSSVGMKKSMPRRLSSPECPLLVTADDAPKCADQLYICIQEEGRIRGPVPGLTSQDKMVSARDKIWRFLGELENPFWKNMISSERDSSKRFNFVKAGVHTGGLARRRKLKIVPSSAEEELSVMESTPIFPLGELSAKFAKKAFECAIQEPDDSNIRIFTYEDGFSTQGLPIVTNHPSTLSFGTNDLPFNKLKLEPVRGSPNSSDWRSIGLAKFKNPAVQWPDYWRRLRTDNEIAAAVVRRRKFIKGEMRRRLNRKPTAAEFIDIAMDCDLDISQESVPFLPVVTISMLLPHERPSPDPIMENNPLGMVGRVTENLKTIPSKVPVSMKLWEKLEVIRELDPEVSIMPPSSYSHIKKNLYSFTNYTETRPLSDFDKFINKDDDYLKKKQMPKNLIAKSTKLMSKSHNPKSNETKSMVNDSSENAEASLSMSRLFKARPMPDFYKDVPDQFKPPQLKNSNSLTINNNNNSNNNDNKQVQSVTAAVAATRADNAAENHHSKPESLLPNSSSSSLINSTVIPAAAAASAKISNPNGEPSEISVLSSGLVLKNAVIPPLVPPLPFDTDSLKHSVEVTPKSPTSPLPRENLEKSTASSVVAIESSRVGTERKNADEKKHFVNPVGATAAATMGSGLGESKNASRRQSLRLDDNVSGVFSSYTRGFAEHEAAYAVVSDIFKDGVADGFEANDVNVSGTGNEDEEAPVNTAIPSCCDKEVSSIEFSNDPSPFTDPTNFPYRINKFDQFDRPNAITPPDSACFSDDDSVSSEDPVSAEIRLVTRSPAPALPVTRPELEPFPFPWDLCASLRALLSVNLGILAGEDAENFEQYRASWTKVLEFAEMIIDCDLDKFAFTISDTYDRAMLDTMIAAAAKYSSIIVPGQEPKVAAVPQQQQNQESVTSKKKNKNGTTLKAPAKEVAVIPTAPVRTAKEIAVQQAAETAAKKAGHSAVANLFLASMKVIEASIYGGWSVCTPSPLLFFLEETMREDAANVVKAVIDLHTAVKVSVSVEDYITHFPASWRPETLMHHACRWGSMDIMKELLLVDSTDMTVANRIRECWGVGSKMLEGTEKVRWICGTTCSLADGGSPLILLLRLLARGPELRCRETAEQFWAEALRAPAHKNYLFDLVDVLERVKERSRDIAEKGESVSELIKNEDRFLARLDAIKMSLLEHCGLSIKGEGENGSRPSEWHLEVAYGGTLEQAILFGVKPRVPELLEQMWKSSRHLDAEKKFNTLINRLRIDFANLCDFIRNLEVTWLCSRALKRLQLAQKKYGGEISADPCDISISPVSPRSPARGMRSPPRDDEESKPMGLFIGDGLDATVVREWYARLEAGLFSESGTDKTGDLKYRASMDFAFKTIQDLTTVLQEAASGLLDPRTGAQRYHSKLFPHEQSIGYELASLARLQRVAEARWKRMLSSKAPQRIISRMVATGFDAENVKTVLDNANFPTIARQLILEVFATMCAAVEKVRVAENLPKTSNSIPFTLLAPGEAFERNPTATFPSLCNDFSIISCSPSSRNTALISLASTHHPNLCMTTLCHLFASVSPKEAVTLCKQHDSQGRTILMCAIDRSQKGGMIWSTMNPLRPTLLDQVYSAQVTRDAKYQNLGADNDDMLVNLGYSVLKKNEPLRQDFLAKYNESSEVRPLEIPITIIRRLSEYSFTTLQGANLLVPNNFLTSIYYDKEARSTDVLVGMTSDEISLASPSGVTKDDNIEPDENGNPLPKPIDFYSCYIRVLSELHGAAGTLDKPSINGCTALHSAIAHVAGPRAMLFDCGILKVWISYKLSLDMGASNDLDSWDNLQSPFQLAKINSKLRARLEYKKGKHPHRSTFSTLPPVLLAATKLPDKQASSVIRVLITLGANPNVLSVDGSSLWDIALLRDSKVLAELATEVNWMAPASRPSLIKAIRDKKLSRVPRVSLQAIPLDLSLYNALMTNAISIGSEKQLSIIVQNLLCSVACDTITTFVQSFQADRVAVMGPVYTEIESSAELKIMKNHPAANAKPNNIPWDVLFPFGRLLNAVLEVASLLGFASTVRSILSSYNVTEIEAWSSRPTRALHWSCITGCADIGRMLIEAGAHTRRALVMREAFGCLSSFDSALGQFPVLSSSRFSDKIFERLAFERIPVSTETVSCLEAFRAEEKYQSDSGLWWGICPAPQVAHRAQKPTNVLLSSPHSSSIRDFYRAGAKPLLPVFTTDDKSEKPLCSINSFAPHAVQRMLHDRARASSANLIIEPRKLTKLLASSDLSMQPDSNESRESQLLRGYMAQLQLNTGCTPLDITCVMAPLWSETSESLYQDNSSSSFGSQHVGSLGFNMQSFTRRSVVIDDFTELATAIIANGGAQIGDPTQRLSLVRKFLSKPSLEVAALDLLTLEAEEQATLPALRSGHRSFGRRKTISMRVIRALEDIVFDGAPISSVSVSPSPTLSVAVLRSLFNAVDVNGSVFIGEGRLNLCPQGSLTRRKIIVTPQDLLEAAVEFTNAEEEAFQKHIKEATEPKFLIDIGQRSAADNDDLLSREKVVLEESPVEILKMDAQRVISSLGAISFDVTETNVLPMDFDIGTANDRLFSLGMLCLTTAVCEPSALSGNLDYATSRDFFSGETSWRLRDDITHLMRDNRILFEKATQNLLSSVVSSATPAVAASLLNWMAILPAERPEEEPDMTTKNIEVVDLAQGTVKILRRRTRGDMAQVSTLESLEYIPRQTCVRARLVNMWLRCVRSRSSRPLGWSIWHEAACLGDTEAITFLLGGCAPRPGMKGLCPLSINCLDAEGNHPFALAVSNGHWSCARVLIGCVHVKLPIVSLIQNTLTASSSNATCSDTLKHQDIFTFVMKFLETVGLTEEQKKSGSISSNGFVPHRSVNDSIIEDKLIHWLDILTIRSVLFHETGLNRNSLTNITRLLEDDHDNLSDSLKASRLYSLVPPTIPEVMNDASTLFRSSISRVECSAFEFQTWNTIDKIMRRKRAASIIDRMNDHIDVPEKWTEVIEAAKLAVSNVKVSREEKRFNIILGRNEARSRDLSRFYSARAHESSSIFTTESLPMDVEKTLSTHEDLSFSASLHSSLMSNDRLFKVYGAVFAVVHQFEIEEKQRISSLDEEVAEIRKNAESLNLPAPDDLVEEFPRALSDSLLNCLQRAVHEVSFTCPCCETIRLNLFNEEYSNEKSVDGNYAKAVQLHPNIPNGDLVSFRHRAGVEDVTRLPGVILSVVSRGLPRLLSSFITIDSVLRNLALVADNMQLTDSRLQDVVDLVNKPECIIDLDVVMKEALARTIRKADFIRPYDSQDFIKEFTQTLRESSPWFQGIHARRRINAFRRTLSQSVIKFAGKSTVFFTQRGSLPSKENPTGDEPSPLNRRCHPGAAQLCMMATSPLLMVVVIGLLVDNWKTPLGGHRSSLYWGVSKCIRMLMGNRYTRMIVMANSEAPPEEKTSYVDTVARIFAASGYWAALRGLFSVKAPTSVVVQDIAFRLASTNEWKLLGQLVSDLGSKYVLGDNSVRLLESAIRHGQLETAFLLAPYAVVPPALPAEPCLRPRKSFSIAANEPPITPRIIRKVLHGMRANIPLDWKPNCRVTSEKYPEFSTGYCSLDVDRFEQTIDTSMKAAVVRGHTIKSLALDLSTIWILHHAADIRAGRYENLSKDTRAPLRTISDTESLTHLSFIEEIPVTEKERIDSIFFSPRKEKKTRAGPLNEVSPVNVVSKPEAQVSTFLDNTRLKGDSTYATRAHTFALVPTLLSLLTRSGHFVCVQLLCRIAGEFTATRKVVEDTIQQWPFLLGDAIRGCSYQMFFRDVAPSGNASLPILNRSQNNMTLSKRSRRTNNSLLSAMAPDSKTEVENVSQIAMKLFVKALMSFSRGPATLAVSLPGMLSSANSAFGHALLSDALNELILSSNITVPQLEDVLLLDPTMMPLLFHARAPLMATLPCAVDWSKQFDSRQQKRTLNGLIPFSTLLYTLSATIKATPACFAGAYAFRVIGPQFMTLRRPEAPIFSAAILGDMNILREAFIWLSEGPPDAFVEPSLQERKETFNGVASPSRRQVQVNETEEEFFMKLRTVKPDLTLLPSGVTPVESLQKLRDSQGRSLLNYLFLVPPKLFLSEKKMRRSITLNLLAYGIPLVGGIISDAAAVGAWNSIECMLLLVAQESSLRNESIDISHIAGAPEDIFELALPRISPHALVSGSSSDRLIISRNSKGQRCVKKVLRRTRRAGVRPGDMYVPALKPNHREISPLCTAFSRLGRLKLVRLFALCRLPCVNLRARDRSGKTCLHHLVNARRFLTEEADELDAEFELPDVDGVNYTGLAGETEKRILLPLEASKAYAELQELCLLERYEGEARIVKEVCFIIVLLCSLGADPSITDRYNRTPLHASSISRRGVDVSATLLSVNCPAGNRDVFGYTAADIAIKNGDNDSTLVILGGLSAAQADEDTANSVYLGNSRDTILLLRSFSLAPRSRSSDRSNNFFRPALNYVPPFFAKSNFVPRLLHRLAWEGKTGCIETLNDLGLITPDTLGPDDMRHTPMEYAAANGKFATYAALRRMEFERKRLMGIPVTSTDANARYPAEAPMVSLSLLLKLTEASEKAACISIARIEGTDGVRRLGHDFSKVNAEDQKLNNGDSDSKALLLLRASTTMVGGASIRTLGTAFEIPDVVTGIHEFEARADQLQLLRPHLATEAMKAKAQRMNLPPWLSLIAANEHRLLSLALDGPLPCIEMIRSSTDDFGNTPLHIAAKYNSLACLQLLLKRLCKDPEYNINDENISPSARFNPRDWFGATNHQGETALQIAVQSGFDLSALELAVCSVRLFGPKKTFVEIAMRSMKRSGSKSKLPNFSASVVSKLDSEAPLPRGSKLKKGSAGAAALSFSPSHQTDPDCFLEMQQQAVMMEAAGARLSNSKKNLSRTGGSVFPANQMVRPEAGVLAPSCNRRSLQRKMVEQSDVDFSLLTPVERIDVTTEDNARSCRITPWTCLHIASMLGLYTFTIWVVTVLRDQAIKPLQLANVRPRTPVFHSGGSRASTPVEERGASVASSVRNPNRVHNAITEGQPGYDLYGKKLEDPYLALATDLAEYDEYLYEDPPGWSLARTGIPNRGDLRLRDVHARDATIWGACSALCIAYGQKSLVTMFLQTSANIYKRLKNMQTLPLSSPTLQNSAFPSPDLGMPDSPLRSSRNISNTVSPSNRNNDLMIANNSPTLKVSPSLSKLTPLANDPSKKLLAENTAASTLKNRRNSVGALNTNNDDPLQALHSTIRGLTSAPSFVSAVGIYFEILYVHIPKAVSNENSTEVLDLMSEYAPTIEESIPDRDSIGIPGEVLNLPDEGNRRLHHFGVLHKNDDELDRHMVNARHKELLSPCDVIRSILPFHLHIAALFNQLQDMFISPHHPHVFIPNEPNEITVSSPNDLNESSTLKKSNSAAQMTSTIDTQLLSQLASANDLAGPFAYPSAVQRDKQQAALSRSSPDMVLKSTVARLGRIATMPTGLLPPLTKVADDDSDSKLSSMNDANSPYVTTHHASPTTRGDNNLKGTHSSMREVTNSSLKASNSLELFARLALADSLRAFGSVGLFMKQHAGQSLGGELLEKDILAAEQAGSEEARTIILASDAQAPRAAAPIIHGKDLKEVLESVEQSERYKKLIKEFLPTLRVAWNCLLQAPFINDYFDYAKVEKTRTDFFLRNYIYTDLSMASPLPVETAPRQLYWMDMCITYQNLRRLDVRKSLIKLSRRPAMLDFCRRYVESFAAATPAMVLDQSSREVMRQPSSFQYAVPMTPRGPRTRKEKLAIEDRKKIDEFFNARYEKLLSQQQQMLGADGHSRQAKSPKRSGKKIKSHQQVGRSSDNPSVLNTPNQRSRNVSDESKDDLSPGRNEITPPRD